ncbi:MAG: T9SS type A sorting domain-containing protein [Balneolaceae bacterium]|nr:T9SS type A sorting domain-containing protein [Balneolaceae bacterium]MBO6547293.1 T9SS type A sorting domain-containing protein [Balneolaceae bacterium]MBO6647760.1 T9SS type A sorting domain-containing protein [Balneolaceae bacterium]
MINDTNRLFKQVFASTLALIMVMMVQVQDVQAQRTVTVDQGVGTLNEAIVSDTTETGERVDSSTVYVLSSGGTYLLDGSIEHRGYHLSIVAEEGWTERPKLIPAVDNGGASSRPFRPRGDLTLRGLYVTNEDELGGRNTRIIRVSENDVTITIDNSHLDKDGQSAFRLDGTGIRLFLTNSIVSNIGTTDSPDNGRGVDDRGNQIDTLWFANNTFYNLTSQIIRDDGGLINYAYFNQNTAVNIGKNIAVEFGPVVKGVMKDNLFINAAFYGYNTNDDDDPLAVVSVDSLTQSETDSLGAQAFTANNNNIYLSASITEAYPDTVEAPVNFNATVSAFIEAQGSASTFLNEDVTFTSGPAAPADVVTTFWTDPTNENPPSFPTPGEGESFDFGYADTFDSYTGGSNGQQLGALSWFGTLVSNEDDISIERPNTFKLNGNYPNPFNPSTSISFDLAEASDVSVEIFNMIGQKVMSIPVQRLAAGSNQNLRVEAGSLTSGIYIYRITAKSGNTITSNTGRMTLIK